MTSLLLIDLPTILLSPTAAVIQWLGLGVLSILNGWQFFSRRSKQGQADEIAQLTLAVNAQAEELKVRRETVDRLRNESVAKSEEIGRLSAATDLRPLVQTIADWVKEGRERFERADRHLARNHVEQTQALAEVVIALKGMEATSQATTSTLQAIERNFLVSKPQ